MLAESSLSATRLRPLNEMTIRGLSDFNLVNSTTIYRELNVYQAPC